MVLNARRSVFVVSVQLRLKPVYSATDTSQIIKILHGERLSSVLPR